ncbi:hypothetical protein BCON_0041g00170 [Botryotinia convoluta]|uniref:Uncharacterized protein n=1 Tax=Botryotinia convoluta TaxID=54673 RepID=A0A4Z1IJL3_9HELO|nr:hypothetical protein BCON_0041g00170 [Botryotinia convoluta]
MVANSTVTPAKRSATKPTIAVTVYVTDYVSTTTSTTTTSTTTTTASATPSFVIASGPEKSQYITYEDVLGWKIL